MKNFQIICDDTLQRAKAIVTKKLIARGLKEGKNGITLQLVCRENFRKDSYRITGNKKNLTITADSFINVIAGCGKILHTSTYQDGELQLSDFRGYVTPDCEIRIVYLANHFRNYFQVAPMEEYIEYLEDMTLLGFNALLTSAPDINMESRDDENGVKEYNLLCQKFKEAASLGMKLVYTLSISTTYKNLPQSIKAEPVYDPMHIHGNYGNIVCISKPEGQKWIDEDNIHRMKTFLKNEIVIDYMLLFPYDEGGCGCEKCRPWGANGYIRGCKHSIELAKKYMPDCKIITSTWTFDEPYQGEWEALCESLKKEKWCDIIQVDSHGDFPRYPLEHGIPGNLPMISFPEICMWGIYPWGKYGATLYPHRLADIWHQTEGLLLGEMLYSEGISDDINKIAIAGLCRNYNCDICKVLADYAAYEFGCKDGEKFNEMVSLIEKNHVIYGKALQSKAVGNAGADPYQDCDAALSDKAYMLAQEIDASLPKWGKNSWRWRILWIRAMMDQHRYRGEDLCANEQTLAAMHELIDIYHCVKNYTNDDDGYHSRVRPECPPYEE